MNKYDFDEAKKKYIEFCKNNDDIQIFAQPWYLDAVCETPNDWKVILIEENKKIIATFPFQYKKTKYGLKLINNPWCCPRLGIWIDYSGRTSNYSKEKLERKITRAVIELLPDYDIFDVTFDSRYKNWHEFYWHGFSQTTYYSYIIEHDKINKNIMQYITKQRRNEVKRAEKKCQFKNMITPGEYYDFFEASYQKRGRVPSYNKKSFVRLCDAVDEHDAGKRYVATDSNETCAALAYVFFDHRRSYHMFGTYDPDMIGGVKSLLTCKSIMDACERGLVIDFEGSMIEGVAKFNSEFNAEREPYYIITNYSDKAKLIKNLSEIKSIIIGKLKRKKA